MARADYLELRFGQSRWLKKAGRLLLLLCIIALWISPAALTWKVLLSFPLALADLLANRAMAAKANTGRVRIFSDDTCMLSTASTKRVFATLSSRHWMSPWFCSVSVYHARGGRRQNLLVCAADNDADEYRRLRMFLRMRPPAADTQRMVW